MLLLFAWLLKAYYRWQLNAARQHAVQLETKLTWSSCPFIGRNPRPSSQNRHFLTECFTNVYILYDINYWFINCWNGLILLRTVLCLSVNRHSRVNSAHWNIALVKRPLYNPWVVYLWYLLCPLIVNIYWASLSFHLRIIIKRPGIHKSRRIKA